MSDVYNVNAIVSAVDSTRADVDASCADVLVACTELIRQTLETMPHDVRVQVIAGVTTALSADRTALLEAIWGTS